VEGRELEREEEEKGKFCPNGQLTCVAKGEEIDWSQLSKAWPGSKLSLGVLTLSQSLISFLTLLGPISSKAFSGKVYGWLVEVGNHEKVLEFLIGV
jgi:hypothetical protein